VSFCYNFPRRVDPLVAFSKDVKQKGEKQMPTNYETLLVNKENGITTIMFNRPEKRNAMSPQLHREMYELLTDLRYDKESRVIVLTGAGENFCAGQDLKQYSLEMESQPPQVRDEVREKVRRWRNEMLRTLAQPVIARITGWCLGGALTVVAGCDIALAAEDAIFGLPEVNFGHFPAGDTTPVLTEHLQPKHGLYYALTGKMMTAKEAARIGLISMALPRADLDREVAELAHCLAEKSPVALKAVKEAWYYSSYSAPDVAYEISNLISQRTIREQGGRRGLEQFVQKKLRPVSGAMKLENT
jgi:trans-feruloyl-CoA hydratase/vanillin synthase